MASLVCVSDAPHSSALPYVCVPLCVCVCVCARACFARLPAQMVVHADIQSVSVSFTFCHANESEMDSEIHARVRTLNPFVCVPISALAKACPSRCRLSFGSISFSCSLYSCLLYSCRRSSAAYQLRTPVRL